MAGFSRELGIDLGTMNTQIAEGNQILIQEPTVVALLTDELKVVEYGTNALNMLGRVPDNIEVIRPIHNSVIAEYEITEKFLYALIRRVAGSMLLFRPKLMITIPCTITSVERRAVHEAGLGSGSRDVALIQQPLAAAIGMGLPIATPSGNMVMCLGGGTTQIAVISMNAIIAAETSMTAGLKFDDAIITYIRKKYGLIIGQPTAEQLKLRIGSAVTQETQKTMDIQGQDQVSSMPKPATISSDDIMEALQQPLDELVNTTRRVLEKTPPELIADIIDRGLAMCGGGALLRGLDKYLTKSLGIPAYLVDNPFTCTVEGAAKAMSMLNVLGRSLPRI